MKTILLLAITALFLATNSEGKNILCYYSSWSVYHNAPYSVAPSDIPAALCTHVLYAFIGVNPDGTLNVEDAWADLQLNGGGYQNTVALKSINPNLKVLLSIGGASVAPSIFADIAADGSKRAAMVASARSFMSQYGFDGVDVDWEVPVASDKANFIALLRDFKTDFEKDGWLVTAAVGADVSDGYDAQQMSDVLDFINVMTYDLYGPWSAYTGQNSALYPSSVESPWEKVNLNLAAAIEQWLSAGAAPSKVIIGIAFYGHSFNLQDANNRGLHAPVNGADGGGPVTAQSGTWAYFEWCMQLNEWSCTWDDEQKVPYCSKDKIWLGIDNEQSVREKAAYINSKGVAGAMVWSIDQDDILGKCGGKNALLHALNDNLS